MADEPGFEIKGRFYPLPTRWRPGDAVLVRQVTAMEWPEFAAAFQEMVEAEDDNPIINAGVMAVAFWQGNPQMSRDKVRRLIERLDPAEWEFLGGEEEADASPPTSGDESPATGEASPTITNGSGSSPEESPRIPVPDSDSDGQNPSNSGTPESVTGAPV